MTASISRAATAAVVLVGRQCLWRAGLHESDHRWLALQPTGAPRGRPDLVPELALGPLLAGSNPARFTNPGSRPFQGGGSICRVSTTQQHRAWRCRHDDGW